MGKVRTRKQLHRAREEQRAEAAASQPRSLRETKAQREQAQEMERMLKGIDPDRFERLAKGELP